MLILKNYCSQPFTESEIWSHKFNFTNRNIKYSKHLLTMLSRTLLQNYMYWYYRIDIISISWRIYLHEREFLPPIYITHAIFHGAINFARVYLRFTVHMMNSYILVLSILPKKTSKLIKALVAHFLRARLWD